MDPDEITLEEGAELVRLARSAVEKYLSEGKEVSPPADRDKFRRPGASFVTIMSVSNGREELRGCIGYTRAFEPLHVNVVHAAIAAATQDPRFPPLSLSELERVVFEVSILSKPELLEGVGRDLFGQIVIGRDGLIVESGYYTGLLLPEVPVEYCWDKETFLSETCLKAYLPPDCWMERDVHVYRFRTKAFKEEKPKGKVFERDLHKEYVERCSKKA